MTKQLSFLPKSIEQTTQEKVEGILESVRIYKQFGMMRKEMKVTPSYEKRAWSYTCSWQTIRRCSNLQYPTK